MSIFSDLQAWTVFVAGLVSFFSPCVLPLIPVYFSYFAAGTLKTDEEGMSFSRGRVFLNTLFFVLGISFAYFILGSAFTSFGRFFTTYRGIFSKVGGIIIIIFALYQLGLITWILSFFKKSEVQTSGLQKEYRFSMGMDKIGKNPFWAFLFGLTFSFAWTPCIGPVLGSVFLLASTSGSIGYSYLLIGLYTLGFTLPFLLLGIFASSVLNFLKKSRVFMQYTIKVMAILMLIMGILLFTGHLNRLSSYFTETQTQSNTVVTEKADMDAALSKVSESMEESTTVASEVTEATEETQSNAKKAFDFELEDQNGEKHTLKDYEGKILLLNFWQTWCGPCRRELPDFEAAYLEKGKNEDKIAIIGVSSPDNPDQTFKSGEQSEQGVKDFLVENNVTYPVLMDRTGSLYNSYAIASFPTTVIISSKGEVLGYVPGSLSAELLEKVITQAQELDSK